MKSLCNDIALLKNKHVVIFFLDFCHKKFLCQKVKLDAT